MPCAFEGPGGLAGPVNVEASQTGPGEHAVGNLGTLTELGEEQGGRPSPLLSHLPSDPSVDS